MNYVCRRDDYPAGSVSPNIVVQSIIIMSSSSSNLPDCHLYEDITTCATTDSVYPTIACSLVL